MKNFRTYDLAKSFYRDCQGLKFKDPFQDQFDRALLSLVLSIAEGSAKPTAKDRKKFYAIAMGSLREVQVILDFCGYANQHAVSDAVAACLYRLIQNRWKRSLTASLPECPLC